MNQLLSVKWWAVALRGVCGILFGLLAFARPGVAIAALVLLFGAYALVDGIFAVTAAVRRRRDYPNWGSLLAVGIVGILAGLWTFMRPGWTALALVILIGSWAVVSGVLEIVAAIRLRKEIRNEWLLALGGVLSIIFGVAVWIAPVAGAVVLAWWIGAYLLIHGAVQLGLGFRLRRWSRYTGERPEALAA